MEKQKEKANKKWEKQAKGRKQFKNLKLCSRFNT